MGAEKQTNTVKPVYSGHLGSVLISVLISVIKCPDNHSVLIFQVSLHVNGYFRIITKCPDYEGVLIFKCPD